MRRAATRRIKEMIDLVARQSPDWGQPGAHERALVTVATMVGALVLARAVDDPKLSDALREAALKHLTTDAADATRNRSGSEFVKEYDDHHTDRPGDDDTAASVTQELRSEQGRTP